MVSFLTASIHGSILRYKVATLLMALGLPCLLVGQQQLYNTMIIKQFYEAMQQGQVDKVSELIDDAYIGHNPNLDGTKASILAVAMQNAKNKENSGKIDMVRIIEVDDFVVVHSKKEFGVNAMASFDLFKLRNGKILEHWDAYQKWEDQTANGNTQVDGPTIPSDLNRTEANKALVREFLENPKGGPELYISSAKYIQHSPFTENGLDGMLRAFEKFEKEGIGFELIKIHHLLGHAGRGTAVLEPNSAPSFS